MHDRKRDLLWQTRIITEVYFIVVFTSVFRTLYCSLALVMRFYWSWGSDDPILCLLYPITKLNCAQIMGSFSSFSRKLLCSYHNIFYSCGTWDHWSSWFSWYLLIACFNWYLLIACFSLCYVFVAYHSFATFGPQYSLCSSKYLPLDMCIAFHSLVEKYTIYGGPQFILAF